jgi:hypothetical protein
MEQGARSNAGTRNYKLETRNRCEEAIRFASLNPSYGC